MTESEIWKDIAEYEGFYQVSNRGNVRSVDRRGLQGYGRRERMLKPGYTSRGYLQVNLTKNGKSKTRTVHRLVAETFIPNPENSLQVSHIDKIKDNNNVENLEWYSSKYNKRYGARSKRFGEKVRAVNAETGEVLTFNSTQEAGRNGYSYGGVAAACRGDYRASTGKLIGGDGHLYKGHRWEYYKEEK